MHEHIWMVGGEVGDTIPAVEKLNSELDPFYLRNPSTVRKYTPRE